MKGVFPRTEYVINLNGRPYFSVSKKKNICFVLEEIEASFGPGSLDSVEVVRVSTSLESIDGLKASSSKNLSLPSCSDL